MTGKLATLWRLTKGQRRRYALLAVGLAGSILLAYTPPLVIKYTIDGVIGGEQAAAPAWVLGVIESLGGRSAMAQHLWIAAFCVVAATTGAGLFTYLYRRCAALASESIARNLREGLYDRLQHLPCSFHDGAETGDLVQRCTSDVDTIRLFLAMQATDLLRASMMILAVVPIMLLLDWRMALAATAVLPVIFTFAVVFFIKIRGAFKAMDEAEGALTSTLQENLTGIRVVRAFARQAFECNKFADRNADHRGKHFKLYVLMASYWALSDLLVFIQMGVVLFAGAYLVSLGTAGGGISVGTLVAFWSYVGLFIWPVRQMGRILADLGKATVSIDRVSMILDAEPEADPPAPVQPPTLPDRLEGRIVFDKVVFWHDDELPVLNRLSFVVEPGQTLAVLGPSGSGKSTIVNLLLRFYDYDDGSITLDGNELRELPRKYVRSQFGVVMQEPFLYSKTLRENIGLGASTLADDQLIEVATAACVHENIVEFDDGYDTLVGERGVTLSGGQRQRVALARALMQDPAILILDDAFSAIDTRTETVILDALRQRHGRQTTIVVAHRVSTLRHADKVIVVENGRVTQIGHHDELIDREGLYQRLWRMQSGEKVTVGG